MQTISVEQLKARIQNGAPIRLLDVREPSERAEFNIGGTLLPLGKIQNMDTEAIDAWKEDDVICYCRSGNRSGQASLILETLGFKHVTNLSGGMLAWQDKFGKAV